MSRKKQPRKGVPSLVRRKKRRRFRFKSTMKFFEFLLVVAQIAQAIVSMFKRSG